MKDNYDLIAIIVWLCTGGVGNLVALYTLLEALVRCKADQKRRILSGDNPGSLELALEKYCRIKHWGPWFIFGNLAAALGSKLWPVGLPILALILAWTFFEYIQKSFFEEEHKVFRYLKKNPQVAAEILGDPKHRYFKIAKELESCGTIVLDKGTQTLEIDGKKYKVEIK